MAKQKSAKKDYLGSVQRIEPAALERSARRVLNDVIATGLFASVMPKGPVSLRFPAAMPDTLFPRLFPEA